MDRSPARPERRLITGTPTPAIYPARPVMVKTPAHPVAVLPPEPGTEGGWQVEATDTGVRALYFGLSGELRGFALTGGETAKRNSLAKEISSDRLAA